MRRTPEIRTGVAIWRWPIVLGVLTAIGLVSALIGDNAWDALSWIGLGVPVVVVGIAVARRPGGRV